MTITKCIVSSWHAQGPPMGWRFSAHDLTPLSPYSLAILQYWVSQPVPGFYEYDAPVVDAFIDYGACTAIPYACACIRCACHVCSQAYLTHDLPALVIGSSGGAVVLAGFWYHSESNFNSKYGRTFFTRRVCMNLQLHGCCSA